MATEPKTNIQDIRVRELAALTCASTIVPTLLDVNIIRVMNSYGHTATFTSRFVQGSLSTNGIASELEHIEKHIERLLDMNVIWAPDDRYKYYKLTTDMVSLIQQFFLR